MKKTILLLLVLIYATSCSYAQATFSTVINYPIASNFADHLAAGDFNHDGKTDIVVAKWAVDYELMIFYQGTSASSPLNTPAAIYPYPHVYPGVNAIAAGDLNNDGRDDIAIAYGDTIGVFFQNASGTMDTLTRFWCSEGEMIVIKVADVDMDGFADIVASMRNVSTNITVFYGREGSGFTQINYPATYAGSFLDDLKVGKVGSDTINSLVRSGGTFYDPVIQLRIRRDRGLDTTILRHVPTGIWNNTNGVEIGRFTDSAQGQIAATYGGNTPTSRLGIWTNPYMSYAPDTVIPVLDNPQPMAAGRLSGSPTEQLVILHGGFGTVSVVDFVHGIDSIPVPCPNNADHDGILIADLNSDGKPDIALVNTYAGLSILLNTTTPPVDTTSAVTHITSSGAAIKLYPNPVMKTLSIEAEGKFSATLYTAVGNALLTESGENKITLNTASLSPGVYFVVAEDARHNMLCRSAIVKQ